MTDKANELADALDEAAGDYHLWGKSTGYAAAAELRRLSALNAELLSALKQARIDVADWACYADQYSREKHDLAGDLARIDTAIARGAQT